MKTFREFFGRNVVGALALMLACHSVALAQSTKTPQQVQVVNAQAQPVPTAPQGTTAIQGEVSVTNFPATTSVNVANSPNVTIANTPTVIVGNDTAAAVPVREIDNAARQPFAFEGSAAWVTGAPNTSLSFSVPLGKRLVIEQAALSASVNAAGGQKVHAAVRTDLRGTNSFYFLVATNVGTAGLYERFVASSQMRMYADPGTVVVVTVSRSDLTADANAADIYVSGYLIDVP